MTIESRLPYHAGYCFKLGFMIHRILAQIESYPSFPISCTPYLDWTNTASFCHMQSLSETTRVIFLSCPPVNEEMLVESTR